MKQTLGQTLTSTSIVSTALVEVNPITESSGGGPIAVASITILSSGVDGPVEVTSFIESHGGGPRPVPAVTTTQPNADAIASIINSAIDGIADLGPSSGSSTTSSMVSRSSSNASSIITSSSSKSSSTLISTTSSSPPPVTPTPTSTPSSALTTGAKAGIGAGVGVGVIFLFGIAYLIGRRRGRKDAGDRFEKAELEGQGVKDSVAGRAELGIEEQRGELEDTQVGK